MLNLNGHNYDVTDDNGVVYEPWITDEAIGYRVWLPNGEVRYLYLHPSTSDTEGLSNCFVYRGPEGDPSIDEPLHYYEPRGGCDSGYRYGDQRDGG